MYGESDPKKKPAAAKKKRQQVRRHYRPSLGRYIETYKRSGENAKQKEKTRGRAEDRPEPAPALEVTEPPRPARWLAVAALVVCAVIAASATILIHRARSQPRYEIHRAHAPILVRLETGTPDEIVFANQGTQKRWVGRAVRDVTEALDDHPGRPVALSLGKIPLSYGELPAPQRQAFHVRLALDPATTYEMSLVTLLGDILDGVEPERPTGRLSVSGLPVEPRIISSTAAEGTNARYRAVIDRLDPLVSDHAYIMAETSLTELQMATAAMPEGLRHRDRRPILFRTNGAWRVLLDHGALAKADPENPAGLYGLVAEPLAAAE